MFAGVSQGWGIAQSLITAASGLGGVCIGAWMTARNQRDERKNTRIREQLQNFYSPLVGMRSEIKAKSDLRQKLHGVADAVWAKMFENIRDPSAKQKIQAENWPRFEKVIKYSDAQTRDELIPLYRKMLDYYSTHLWLANKSTLAHYATLTEFVEIWNRHLDGSLPIEVITAIDHKEAALLPFYEDLQQNFDLLSQELSE